MLDVVRFGGFPSYTNEKLFQTHVKALGVKVDYDIRAMGFFMGGQEYRDFRGEIDDLLAEYGGQVLESP